jgi:CheY-like chemotaxis protein
MFQVFESVDHDCHTGYACADIVISDINMPTKTGIELFRELRQKGCKIKYWPLMSADWTESNLKDA